MISIMSSSSPSTTTTTLSNSARSISSHQSSTPSSSFRIGNGRVNRTAESTMLRSLRSIRLDIRTMDVHGKGELIFWNCCDFSPMVLHSLEKLFIKEGRQFNTIKFFFTSSSSSVDSASCTLIRRRQQQQQHNEEEESINNNSFARVLTMILDSNCTTELIIKGWNPIMDDDAFAAISTSLASTNTSLINLRLIDQRSFTTNAVTTFCAGLSKNVTLKSLAVRACQLDDDSLSRIVRGCETSKLSELDLSYNYAANLTLDALSDVLASSKSSLSSLTVSHQQGTHPASDHDDHHDRFQHEQQQQQDRPEGVEVATVSAFCRALHVLANVKTLKYLDMSGNPVLFVEPTVLDGLVHCLITNHTIEYVNVSIPDGIPSHALEYLANHCLNNLTRHSSLKTLVLFGDNDGTTILAQLDDGVVVDAIVNGLTKNTNCTLISLGNTVGNAQIQHCLDMNRVGRHALHTMMMTTTTMMEDTTTTTTTTPASPPPLGIWSHILARAALTTTITAADGMEDNDDDDDDDDDDLDENDNDKDRNRVASVLFNLLQGPALLEQRW